MKVLKIEDYENYSDIEIELTEEENNLLVEKAINDLLKDYVNNFDFEKLNHKDLDYYLNLPYKIEITPIPKEGYFAKLPEFDEVSIIRYGENIDEVIEDLQELKVLKIKEYLNNGIEIPEPKLNNKDPYKNKDERELFFDNNEKKYFHLIILAIEDNLTWFESNNLAIKLGGKLPTFDEIDFLIMNKHIIMNKYKHFWTDYVNGTLSKFTFYDFENDKIEYFYANKTSKYTACIIRKIPTK
ncbi:MAG: type II toxin-antitoxin system HicB family antitoxin [bacterium]